VLPNPPHDLLDGASLFLDLDGTLVEIASRPDAVRVDDRLRAILARLSTKLQGRLAIISGRPAQEVRSFFPGSSIAIAGSHGVEILWPDGRLRQPSGVPLPQHVLDLAGQFNAAHPGVLIERKPFGIAFHYRLSPADEQACHTFARALAAAEGYAVQTGKMVIEVKLLATDKGHAVERLLAGPAMKGTVPVFVGDDDTDEAGFRRARQLGGAGVLVGPPRSTAAAYGLENVDTTLKWLAAAGERGR